MSSRQLPAKSPAGKSTQSKKKSNNSIMLPGLDKLPRKKGSKPVVVVVVKGGGAPPNLSNLPFMLTGTPKKKKKNKKGSKKKKTPKKEAKKIAKQADDDEDSDSDRMSAPEIPKAQNQKGGARSNRSVSSPLASSVASTPGARTPKKEANTPKKSTVRGVKAKEQIVINDGIVDRECVPMFMCIDGPIGTPIIVPLDARDSSGLVPEGGPQPLKSSPSQSTKGYLLLSEEGLLYFNPLKQCPSPPPSSTLGTLHKFLNNSNVFIADSGPPLPDEKSYTRGGSAAKDKIGQRVAVSGHITILSDKAQCKFTRVMAGQAAPFYPTNAAMGVLVRDQITGLVFWVPTENRFVGPLLSQNISIPSKQVAEMAIVGQVYRDSIGSIICESPSNKSDNLIGFIMSSATGVPLYAAKPETAIPKPASSSIRRVVSPTAVSVTNPSSAAYPSPPVDPPISAVAAADSPISATDVPPLPASPLVVASPISPTPTSDSPSKSAAVAPAAAATAAPTPSTPSGDTTPSFGWSLFSSLGSGLGTLGSVLNTTASVISTTATAVSAVTEAASGGGATLPSPSPLLSIHSPSPQSTTSKSSPSTKSPVPPVTSPSLSTPTTATSIPSAVPIPIVTKRVETASPTKVSISVPPTVSASAAIAAPPTPSTDAAPAVKVSVRVSVADAASNGANGVKDSTSNGGCESDHKSYTDKSDVELDELSEGGLSIGEQMTTIYRNLLESQNELVSGGTIEGMDNDIQPPEQDASSDPPKEEEKEEEKEEKVERRDQTSLQEQAKRKAENSKEYKKFLDDRSVSFS
ncbi:hypothetical protein PFISCL1PPCAC_15377, partial [Pristionchus fissidentatus]